MVLFSSRYCSRTSSQILRARDERVLSYPCQRPPQANVLELTCLLPTRLFQAYIKMVRSKSIPTSSSGKKSVAARRAFKPTGWAASKGWWLGLGQEHWESAPTFVMTDAAGLPLPSHDYGIHGDLPLPTTRGCIQAFSHFNGHESTAAGAECEHHKRLTAILSASVDEHLSFPELIFDRRRLMTTFFANALRLTADERSEYEARAAAAAGEALRVAGSATETISISAVQLAFDVLQYLPPAISVSQHEVVARSLLDEHPSVMAYAAHTVSRAQLKSFSG